MHDEFAKPLAMIRSHARGTAPTSCRLRTHRRGGGPLGQDQGRERHLCGRAAGQGAHEPAVRPTPIAAARGELAA